MSDSILFVDTNVADYQTLLSDLSSDVEVHILNTQKDGVLQMAAVLKNRANLDSIHIVSHGSSSALSLGAISLNNNDLDYYADALKQIGASLTTTGDILLYGCDVAQGTQGIDFIHKLSEITGADIAASTNVTGNAALGGDWVLEANTGAIEENSLQVIDYKGIFPTFTATTGLDNVVGSTTADTINIAVGMIQSGDSFNGETGTDTIKLSTATGGTYDFTVLGTTNLLGIEKLTFSNTGGTATAVFNANQFSATNLSNSLVITGNTGTQVISVVLATNDIFNAANWTFITWTSGTDSIIFNGSIGAETITGTPQNDSISGDAGNDLITGDPGADTLTGGGGVDSFNFSSGTTILATTGGTLTGNDVITDFRLGETLKFASAAIVANGSVNGTDSTLLLNTGVTVKSHNITNGIITFDDVNTFASAVPLTTVGDIAAVTQYLQNNNLSAAGKTVAFTATISGTSHTYVYIQGTAAGAINSSDVLIDVKNVSTTGITATAPQISLFVPPAITSITENSGGGINAAEASDGTPVVVNLTNTGAIAGDTLTLNWGSQSIPYSLQLADISNNSATVTIPLATITNQSDGTFNVSAKITDAVLNASVASAFFPVTVDTTALSVTLTSSASAIKIGETATITATFSEAPVGFTGDDFTSNAGAFNGFATVDATHYTVIFTPTANSSVTDSAITIAAGSYTDIAGNAGSAGVKPALAMDMIAPAALTFALNNDSGVSNADDITNDKLININNLESGAGWEYSTDGNSGTPTWTTGTGSTFNLAANACYAVGDILVRQTDAAGNLQTTTPIGNVTAITVDSTAPTIPTDSDATTNAVPENACNATAVGLTVHSTDANGVVYSLSDNAGGRFTINTTTGMVTVANGNLLNYEENTRHTVTAVATDQAGNSASQTFAVAITNVDEIAPSFTSGDTATAIDENSGAGQEVYIAASTDTQDYVSGTTTYSLKAVDDVASFTVNGTTGTVTLTGNPNYEIKNSYTFTVIATDAAGNFSEQAVALAITDLPEAITYSTTTFNEAAVNDGSITATCTLTLTHETFAKNVGDVLGAVSHVPAGLTAHLVKTTDNSATLSFTGKATAHENINNINNLTVSFGNVDFSGGSTVGITGVIKNDLVIDFADPLPVVVPPAIPINHAPTGTVTIVGTAQVGQVLTVTNTLADADGLGAITYQWKIGNTISPIKSDIYMPTVADLGKTIIVTANYIDGLGKAESVNSLATAAVTSAPVIVPPLVTPIPAPSPSPTPPPVLAPIVDAPTAPTPVYEESASVVVAPVTPVIPPSFTVDGVTVQQNFTRVYGVEVGHFSTPPILSTRVEDYRTAHPNAADIPLGSVNSGAGVSLALPTGVGFQADGVTSLQFINTAVSNFGDDIKAIMGVNSPAFAEGMRFLFDTTAGQTFFEQKIVLTSDAKAVVNQPIIVDGTHTGSTAVLNTFVIDASALPKGSVLELKHVDFAVIKGELTVKLDPTSNTVHLASTQNPQTVLAQAGDDVVQVDGGSRLIHGGLGTDTVKIAGKSTDYDIKQVFAVITVTSKTKPADVQTLVNVEKIAFSDGAIILQYDSQINAVAGTYQKMFGRQSDLTGEQFWANSLKNQGVTLGKMALSFMHSDELMNKIGFDISKADIPTQVEQFYQSFLGRASDALGKAFWVDKLTTGELNLESLVTTVIQSLEMQNHYAAPAQWDFKSPLLPL